MVLLEVIMLLIIMYNLRISSYNCRSLSTLKRDFVKTLLLSCDILFLQEHWLSDDQLSSLGELDGNFTFTGVSGFGNREILSGRPYGGCAILWRSSLKFSIDFLSVRSRRVAAIKLSNEHSNFLLVNVYMPFEDGNCNADEFSDVLFSVECLLADHIDCHYLIGGDFNVDFTRSTMHTALLRSFLDTHNLLCASDFVGANIDFTYQFNMLRFSLIDNFLLSPFLFHNILKHVDVIHDINNMSDHEPIKIELCVSVARIDVPYIADLGLQKVSWAKATESHIIDYHNELANRLKSIVLPLDTLTCCDRRCNILKHSSDITEYANNIADVCIRTGLSTVPRMRPYHRSTPGFTQHVEPARKKSMFWHLLWMDCGRPKTGHVADCMRRTRAAYHYAMRSVKRHADEITRERFATALLHNNSRNFWTEVKKIRASKMTCNGVVDGHSDANEIASIFGEKYHDLYTSVSYDERDMHEISDTVDELISDDDSIEFVITPLDVLSAISHIKHHKNDVDNMLTSDHLIYAPNDLHVHISMLFSAMLMHGCVPNLFMNSSIRPIPKGHNLSTCDSSNYRGIAISSVFSKVFENVVLIRYRHLLSTCDLQFGFKKKHSTQMCTMVLKETISYYLSNKSKVFCTFLDATKAFDRINYCKLFKLLLCRSLPYCIIRVLLSLYTNNYVYVSWAGSNSSPFLACNGVKQGGVLSPVLFCVYMDVLLNRLSDAGVGCYMGGTFVGVLAYADDVVLIAPTPSAMNRLLSICDEFAVEYNVLFNSSKSKCIYFHPKSRLNMLLYRYNVSDLNFTINGNVIEFVDSYKHLGHVISSDLADDADISEKRAVFIGQANNVLCYFANLGAAVKYRLFTVYCTSFFGCELWRINYDYFDGICTAWRRAVRRIWSLPYNAHSRLLPLLCNSFPIFDQFCVRFLNFVRRCLSDQSSILVKTVVRQALMFLHAQSPLGANFIYCTRRYCFNLSDFVNCSNYTSHIGQFRRNEHEHDDISFLRELIDLRDGALHLSNDMHFSYDEMTLMINYISAM